MKTNELIYKCSKEVNNTVVYVTIRLNDECKNGCNDFSITGSVYKKGKPKTDKNMIRYGCCHEDILEAFPEFKMFVDLHLCSSDGYPSFLGKNAAYWISIGEDEKAMRDLRCDSDMYDKLHPYYIDNLLFKNAISDFGLLDTWEEQAKKAISYLEELTGDEFIENKHVPFFSPEEEMKIANGEITLDLIKEKQLIQREEKRKIKLAEIEKKFNEKVRNAELEKEVNLLMLDFDSENWIYYNHCNTLAFNWKSYEKKVTEEEVNEFFKNKGINLDFKIEFKK